jgi:hydroxypyruvate reductase
LARLTAVAPFGSRESGAGGTSFVPPGSGAENGDSALAALSRSGVGIRVIAAGKAAPAMAAAAARHFGPRIRAGLIVGPPSTRGRDVAAWFPDPASSAIFECVPGGHPLPTAGSEAAGRKALALADSMPAADALLVLISGGASALMAVPADGITLDDKRAATQQLLRAGAEIHALNTIRKHLSAIKGGWLAARARGACHALAISDVVGDDVSVIASGPTVADASTFAEALALLRRFGGEDAYPAPVAARLRRGAAGMESETPKPGDARLASSTTAVIGSRRDAMAGAAKEAASLGYHVIRIDDPVTGEARMAAPAHIQAALARAAAAGQPTCIVSSGETTVHVTGHGRGGRNLEFALAAAEPLGGLRRAALVASVGTDGVDGPTDAAGAMADDTTLTRARAAGLSPERSLSDNDTYPFFDAIGDLIRTGPTGTNVGDLQVILLA